MLAKNISEMLQARAPLAYRDHCIVEGAGSQSLPQVAEVTGAFGLTSDFARYPANYGGCGKQRWVIKSGGTTA